MNKERTKGTWTTCEGDVILIRDMTDSHLVNVIRMLDREALEEFGEEFGEGWTDPRDYFCLNEAYGELLDETRRRGLDHKEPRRKDGP